MIVWLKVFAWPCTLSAEGVWVSWVCCSSRQRVGEVGNRIRRVEREVEGLSALFALSNQA